SFMPIYEYKCENGHVFDVIQKISDDPLSECQECGASAARVLQPVAVHFKGSGFHNTDYRKKSATNGASETSSDSGTSGSEPKSGDSKTESKAASTSD